MDQVGYVVERLVGRQRCRPQLVFVLELHPTARRRAASLFLFLFVLFVLFVVVVALFLLCLINPCLCCVVCRRFN